MSTNAGDLIIRCGLQLEYEAREPTPILLLIQPRSTERQRIVAEEFTIDPQPNVKRWEDCHGNISDRFILPAGRTTVRYDSLFATPPHTDDHNTVGEPVAFIDLPADVIRYTLPSRYCDSDRLMDFAFAQFGQFQNGFPRVQAICDWVHQNIAYRFASGSPYTSASEIISQRFGVCRDFAHTAVALSRCFNIPARYVTGHLPDVGVYDPGSAMDFHAYFEVYIAGRWHTFDARFNQRRLGRVHIASGLDAVDAAFSTLFGAAWLASFQVWTYQVDPAVVKIGDPIDLAKRLDGTPEVRYPAAG